MHYQFILSMKKILLIVLALTGLAAKAQYFHHIYGTTNGEKLSAGINTNVLGLGHFLVGHHGKDGLAVSRTDVTGNVTGAPYFNGWYLLASTTTGSIVDVAESRTFELDNGNGFGIIGQYTDPSLSSSNTGIFYLQLNPSGTVLNVFTYLPAGGGPAKEIFRVGGVSESIFSSGNTVYVTGTTTDGGSRLDPFAMTLDVNTGAVVWAYVYDLAMPSGSGQTFANDMVESPYFPTGVKELVVVGRVTDPSSGALPDGFTLRLEVNTGSPITGSADLYGTTASYDEFNAIAVAQSTKGGSDGFIIGGASDVNGSLDFWEMKTDQKCGTLWAVLHDYSFTSGVENVCLDIIERKNTSGNFEYFAAGYVRPGVLGNYDIVVVKTDDGGTSYANGEFTYGDSKIDYGIAIDQYNGTGSDGISVFGFREGASSPIINGNYDMYLVKAYFNGETPCNQKIATPPDASGPKIYTSVSASTVDKLNYKTTFRWRATTANDKTVCYKAALSGGSNAKLAPKDNGENQAIVSPNPMQAGNPVIDVSIESETSATAQIAIFDMLGKQHYNGTVTLAPGKNVLPVDISSSTMSAGMYSVRITLNNENKTILLMVK
jgi:hypothetical protein